MYSKTTQNCSIKEPFRGVFLPNKRPIYTDNKGIEDSGLDLGSRPSHFLRWFCKLEPQRGIKAGISGRRFQVVQGGGLFLTWDLSIGRYYLDGLGVF